MSEQQASRQQPQQIDSRPPIVVLRDRLMSRHGELRAALTDTSPENFIRAVMTSVALNPDILGCSWQSIWNACLRACRDGLLPDGIDGAMVPFKGNVTWIPMYQGLLRRFRRSGQFKWVTAGIVRQGELFEHYVDQDGEHFKHVPGDNVDLPIVKAYAVASTKDGGIFLAVLPFAEIEKIRAMSKATREDSPWRMWYSEMAKKTALRRLSKVLPSARDLDVEEPPEAEQTAASGTDANLPRITTARDALDHFAGKREQIAAQPTELDQAAKPTELDQAAKPTELDQAAQPTELDQAAAPEADADPLRTAYREGQAAKSAGVQRRALPGEYRDVAHQRHAVCWTAGHDGSPMPAWGDER